MISRMTSTALSLLVRMVCGSVPFLQPVARCSEGEQSKHVRGGVGEAMEWRWGWRGGVSGVGWGWTGGRMDEQSSRVGKVAIQWRGG